MGEIKKEVKKERIVGMMVVGTGDADRWLEQVFDRLDELCDDIVVACNAVDKKTIDMCNKRAHSYDYSNYEWGKKQWLIKQTLVSKDMPKYNPDWVICVDSDEILNKRFTREKAHELMNRGEIAYTFYCVHLWDREDQMRVDGGWGNFRNVRFYKYIKETGLIFQKTPLHCGLAPIYAYNWCADAEFYFKHYGYINAEDRKNKVARYKKYDPKAKYLSRDWYNSIISKPILKKFDEDNFMLSYNPKQPDLKKLKTENRMEKTIYVKNKYGRVSGVRESMLKEHLSHGCTIVAEAPEIKVNKAETPTKEIYECEICGFIAKSKAGLKAHLRKHK